MNNKYAQKKRKREITQEVNKAPFGVASSLRRTESEARLCKCRKFQTGDDVLSVERTPSMCLFFVLRVMFLKFPIH
jgi:hypothetical protein